jgi:hypothetical protein
MGQTPTAVTNVERQTFVQFTTSVQADQGSIIPERYTSISSPPGFSLVPTGLNTDSGPQVLRQQSTENR